MVISTWIQVHRGTGERWPTLAVEDPGASHVTLLLGSLLSVLQGTFHWVL